MVDREQTRRDAAAKYHAGHGPNPHPNCPVCQREQTRRDAEREPNLILEAFVDDFGNELDCTHCGGEGTCDANANPMWDCTDEAHPCHACGGSGLRRDQRIF